MKIKWMAGFVALCLLLLAAKQDIRADGPTGANSPKPTIIEGGPGPCTTLLSDLQTWAQQGQFHAIGFVLTSNQAGAGQITYATGTLDTYAAAQSVGYISMPVASSGSGTAFFNDRTWGFPFDHPFDPNNTDSLQVKLTYTADILGNGPGTVWITDHRNHKTVSFTTQCTANGVLYGVGPSIDTTSQALYTVSVQQKDVTPPK